jgi:hypothetical protein
MTRTTAPHVGAARRPAVTSAARHIDRRTLRSWASRQTVPADTDLAVGWVPMRRFAFAAVLLPAASAFLAGGCWMKTGERPLNRSDEDRVNRIARLDLRPGHTTADEVRRVLGPPTYQGADGHFVAYYWESVSTWLFKRTNIDAGNFELDKQRRWDRRLLVMQFDENGVLRRHRTRRVQDDVIPSDAVGAVAANWGIAAEVRSGQPATSQASTIP